MGRGELRKNHIVLIRQVLDDMAVDVPHLGSPAFLGQRELPDASYPFALYQLCLAQFPDSLHNEILGFNLGAEMFGLGELCLQQIDKLSAHGFDTSYERAHLTIDNMSAGHARQAAEIIVSFLDDVHRTAGPEAVQREWRRVWRGYASYASFVERRLVLSVAARERLRSRAGAAAPRDAGARAEAP
ncbi:hypothetical protein GCM10020295_16180 [Streptomyces cinereospinus]